MQSISFLILLKITSKLVVSSVMQHGRHWFLQVKFPSCEKLSYKAKLSEFLLRFFISALPLPLRKWQNAQCKSNPSIQFPKKKKSSCMPEILIKKQEKKDWDRSQTSYTNINV